MKNMFHVKTFTVIVAFALVFIIGHANAAEINIGLEKLSPQPVEPGQDFNCNTVYIAAFICERDGQYKILTRFNRLRRETAQYDSKLSISRSDYEDYYKCYNYN